MMVQQILDHHRTTGEDGAMVFLDQEKAYDKVDRRYLEKCLIKFGVGPRWRTGAECLLTGLSARVLVNGFQSNTLEVQQGVPQGDPLSPVLYDLAVEPLLCYLRNKLKGLPLGGHPFQCSAFADDIAVGLADEEDQRVLLKGLQLHEKACNAKLNLDKSEFLPLSLASETGIPAVGKPLPRDKVFSHLGIPFHPQAFPLPDGWFNSLIDKFQATVASWQKRKLSLAGKVLVLNSRLLSKVWYLGYHVSFPPPLLQTAQQNCIWISVGWQAGPNSSGYSTSCS